MRTLHATPHTITGETANYMLMGREVRLPEHLTHLETIDGDHTATEYATQLKERMESVGEQLRAQQTDIRTADNEEPNLYTTGDLMWLKSFYKKKRNFAKLPPKYIGPYIITEVLLHHI